MNCGTCLAGATVSDPEGQIDADRDRLLELISVAESHDANLGRGLRILAQSFDYRSLLGLLQIGGNE